MDSAFIIALSKWQKEKITSENKEILFNDILAFIKSKTLKEQTCQAILELLLQNDYLSDDILNCMLRNHHKNNQKLLVKYINSCDKLSDNNLAELNRLLIIDTFNLNIIEQFYSASFYKLYLLNAINNNTLSKRDFDNSIITSSLLLEIKKYDPELFLQYRLYLLSQELEIKKRFAFTFSENYPFVQEDEKNRMNMEDCLLFINETVIELNKDSYIQLVKYLAKTPFDIYSLSKHILNLTSTLKLEIFNQLPFVECGFVDLTITEKNEILELYKESKALNSEIEIIKYLKLTGDLNESLEKRIFELFQLYGANNVPMPIRQEYISMLNDLRQCTEVTLKILTFIDVNEGLCSEITDKLFAMGEYKMALIGKTLFENNFQYNDLLDLNLLIDIYSSNSSMSEIMIKNHEFLVKVYQSQNYKKLNIEQLKVYNSWGQNIELLREVLNKMNNDDERKQYILNISKMENPEDANDLPALFNNVKFKNLLKDEDISKKIRDLMDKASYGYRGYLTKLINDLRQCS